METNKSSIGGLAAVLLLIVAGFAMVTGAEARIGPVGAQYDRQAMIEEAYFAVTGVVGSRPPSPTMVNGQWNYRHHIPRMD